MRTSVLAASCTLAAFSFCLEAHADRVVTADGRILTAKKAREEGEGYRLTFKHGDILVSDPALVQAVEIEGDMSDYEPANDKERDFLEKGYVRFEGRWMSKPSYQNELDKRAKASRERLEAMAEHSEFHNPWTKETKHFQFLSDTSPEILDHYAELLEAYYNLMDKRIGIKPTPTYRKKKMTVNIYKSHEEFLTWSKEFGVGPTTLGFFFSGNDSLNFFHDYSEPALSDWVSLHECTHLLTFLIDQQYRPQIWLNEAVADYFGSAEITRNKKGKVEIEPGKLQLDRILTVQQAYKDDSYVRLEDLFLVDREAFTGFEYAHAWSFVYFLNNYNKGKYAKGFKKAFKDIYTLSKGIEFESVPSYGQQGTGKQVSPQEIRRYLLKCIKVKDVAKLETQWKTFIEEIELDAPVARLKRGIRSVRRGKLDEGIEDLNAAIDGGAGTGEAYASRGQALMFKGKFSDARKDLEKAMELDPLNAVYQYQMSQVLNVRSGSRLSKKSADADKGEEAAVNAAGLAMELDPENDSYREWYLELKEGE